MGKKKVAVEDLVIPPQNNRLCGIICVCQMTLVLSTVAIVYLTVAVYMPSIKEFNSGIDETPVMCTTTQAKHIDNCTWVSCAEWCLSNPSGPCTQIFVNLRRNGSSLLFKNCTNSFNKKCYGINYEEAPKLRCILEQCGNFTGLFNCSDGNCTDISSVFQCTYVHSEHPVKCAGRRGRAECMDLEGVYDCKVGVCKKLKPPYNCDRKCYDIPNRNKNVILINGDHVFLSKCLSVIDLDQQVEVWNDSDDSKIMMASCYTIENTSNGAEAHDCVNGSLLERNQIPDQTNFTHLTQSYIVNATRNGTIAPLEDDLTISNYSAFKMNLEGCVNTLQDECRGFFKDFGHDGSDYNARARFPCFYAPDKTDVVVSRFNLKVTKIQFLIAFFLPTILFVVSCTILVIIQKKVEVGDDAKMRFKGSDDTETLFANNKSEAVEETNKAI